METIKINHGGRKYEIQSIMQVSAHVLRVVFDNQVPEAFGDIEVYTSGGILCSFLPGYDTVYKEERRTVYLSDDGSLYQSLAEPEEYKKEVCGNVTGTITDGERDSGVACGGRDNN